MKIGILGGGQLARMMALAGYPLGHEFVVLDPAKDACAGQLCEHICADYNDEEALAELADRCEVITLDFENVPVTAVDFLADKRPVRPGAKALGVAQDRLAEKNLFTELGIPCAPFAAVDSLAALEAALGELGYPAVLKTRRLGYDGKGQVVIEEPGAVNAAWEELGGQPLILEGFVRFKRELSIIAVRSTTGDTVFYPLTENRHKNGILVTSFAPAAAPAVEPLAQRHITKLLDHLDYCGVLTLELFDLGDHLVANEIAPRVHNSGHWTIDGAVTSQFENHIRAVLGWPLGATRAHGASAMLNWIGAMPDPATGLSYPDAHWHDYGKKPRAGRKVGHVNLNATDIVALQSELAKFAMALGQQLKNEGADAFNTSRA
ncbi:MAG: 5-(carboxyamino)imidazole ribonucleotide synthase [Pseudomonadota bacterium]